MYVCKDMDSVLSISKCDSPHENYHFDSMLEKSSTTPKLVGDLPKSFFSRKTLNSLTSFLKENREDRNNFETALDKATSSTHRLNERANHRLGGWHVLMSICFIALTFFLVPGAHCESESNLDEIGFVMKINGSWLLNGALSPEIKLGQSLPNGGIIQAQSPNTIGETSSITIAYADGTAKTFSCPKDCIQPIPLKSIKRESSPKEKMMAVVGRLFNLDPTQYVHTISRGASQNSANLLDSVVMIEGDRVDLSPVFEEMKKESYLVEFREIREITNSAVIDPVLFTRDSKFSSQVSGLKPGLYRLNLLELNPITQQNEPTGNWAWVLVSPTKEYEKAATSFKAAVSLTKKWDKNIDRDTVRSFLQAYLDFLARQEKTSITK